MKKMLEALLEKERAAEIVFLDPPYEEAEEYEETLKFLARHHAAKLVVRVECEMFSNCPRAVHDLASGGLSAYVPRPGYDPPAPEWKPPACRSRRRKSARRSTAS